MRRNLATLAVSAFVLASLAIAGCDESTYVAYLPGDYGYYDEYYYDDGGYWYGDVWYEDGYYYDGYYDDGYYFDDDYYDDYYDDLEDYYLAEARARQNRKTIPLAEVERKLGL